MRHQTDRLNIWFELDVEIHYSFGLGNAIQSSHKSINNIQSLQIYQKILTTILLRGSNMNNFMLFIIVQFRCNYSQENVVAMKLLLRNIGARNFTNILYIFMYFLILNIIWRSCCYFMLMLTAILLVFRMLLVMLYKCVMWHVTYDHDRVCLLTSPSTGYWINIQQ